MIATHVSAYTLRRAADEIGVQAEIESTSATRHRVKLYPLVPFYAYTPSGRRRGKAGDAPYQRESVGYGTAGRRVHAVCWHGFRDYFRAVYRRAPQAIFRTAVATWRGSADFEARHHDTGLRNIGPPIAPVAMVDACRCPERGAVNRPRPLTLSEVMDEEQTITPEQTLAQAGVSEERWSDYNRKFNELLRGGPK